MAQMKHALDSGVRDPRSSIFEVLKSLTPLLYRQYVANSSSDREISFVAAGKKHASTKLLASIAFDALDASIALLCGRFSIHEVSEVAQLLEREMGSSRDDQPPSEIRSQSSENIQLLAIHSWLNRLKREFVSLEELANHDQVRQITSIMHSFLSIMSTDELIQHQVFIGQFPLLT